MAMASWSVCFGSRTGCLYLQILSHTVFFVGSGPGDFHTIKANIRNGALGALSSWESNSTIKTIGHYTVGGKEDQDPIGYPLHDIDDCISERI